MSIRRMVVLGILFAGAVAAIWQSQRAPEVSITRPIRGEAAEIVYASGVVEPKTWAKVTSLIRERLVELCNCEAQAIDKGAVLARLDSSEAKASLLELEARLNLARENLTRLTILKKRRVTSQQALDQARAEADRAEAMIAAQKARLANYVLRAPSPGVVLRQDGEVGEIAEPGEVLFWVGQPKPLLVVADVNEEDIPRVDPGQRVLLRSDAFPKKVLEGTVDSITPKGDPVTKTYRVRIALPDDTPLRIGMSTDVNIVTRIAADALLVPSLALRNGELFIAENGRAKSYRPEIGIQGIEKVQILTGLDETAQIITPFPVAITDSQAIDVKGQ